MSTIRLNENPTSRELSWESRINWIKRSSVKDIASYTKVSKQFELAQTLLNHYEVEGQTTSLSHLTRARNAYSQAFDTMIRARTNIENRFKEMFKTELLYFAQEELELDERVSKKPVQPHTILETHQNDDLVRAKKIEDIKERIWSSIILLDVLPSEYEGKLPHVRSVIDGFLNSGKSLER